MKDVILLIILSIVIINISYGASVDYNNFYKSYRPNQYDTLKDRKNETNKDKMETEIQNEIKIENKIKIDDTLKLYIDKSEKRYKWELISRPKFSKLSIKDESPDITIRPDISGKYIITVEINKKKILKEILVHNDTIFSKEDLIEKIKESIDTENLEKLKEYTSIFKKNYPEEIRLSEYYEEIINLAKEKDQVDIEFNYIRKFLNEFKLTSKTKKEYTSRYIGLISKKDFSENEIMKRLDFITEKGMYNREIANLFLNMGYTNKAIEILEMEYTQNGEKDLIETLQKLYIKMNRLDKAIYYTRLSGDNVKLAKIYFDIGDLDSFKKLKEDFNQEQVLNIQEYVDAQKSKDEEKKYYENGLEALNNYRFDMAKLYYLKILENSKNDELIKKSLKDLAKLHFLKQEYQDSLDYYEKYQNKFEVFNEPEIKYNMAINHFNLEEFDKSKKILNDILLYYPYTVWENKSRIYISKIKNKS